MQLVLGLSVFTISLAAVLTRPARVSEDQAVLAGALAMLLFGIVSPRDAAQALLAEWNAYLFFLGLMVAAAFAEHAGLFTLLAAQAARWAKGSGRRLFFALFAIGTVVTAALSNDATALLLTPVVATLVVRLGLPPMPFLFATTFIADTASFVLPISNPINVILLGEQLDLVTFLRFLLVPSLAAIVLNTVLFASWFRRELQARYAPAGLAPFDRPPSPLARWTLVGLSGLVVASVVAAWLRVPLGPVVVAGAVLLAGIAWRLRAFSVTVVQRGISWSLFGFLTGLIVMVRGLEQLGVTARLGEWLLELGDGSPLRSLLVTSFGTALGANLINNVPMALVVRAALADVAGSSASGALPYAALLGADLGPNLTIMGSLATMLWLFILRQRGLTVSVRQYFVLGSLVVPATLLVGTLWIWLVA